MPAHSRSKNGVASLAYVAGIHVFRERDKNKGVDGRDKPGHDGIIDSRCVGSYVSANAPRVSVVTATRCFAGSLGGPTKRRESAATNSAFGIGLANR